MITIKTPFWNEKAFGVAADKVAGPGTVEVECSYKDKNEEYIYPHIYEMDHGEVRSYPSMKRKGTLLHIVPVSDFSVQKYRHADRDKK